MEQLSALRYLLLFAFIPFVDFALWGPHNDRFQRRQAVSGLILGRDGSWQKAELWGPSCLDAWVACFDVLACALIMLGAVFPPFLRKYKEYIIRMVRLYGEAGCWAIIYQADVRFRREHIELIRRRLSDERQAALERDSEYGSLTGFDPERPWDKCFEVATSRDEAEFWKNAIETPCFLVLARARNSATFVDGDAPIALNPSQHLASATSSMASLHPQISGNAQRGPGPKKAKSQSTSSSYGLGTKPFCF